MTSKNSDIFGQVGRCGLGTFGTLAAIHLIDHSLTILIFLLLFWYFLFRPLRGSEIIACIIAGTFFLFQNYIVLKEGGFAFKHRDILLMPYFEPFLWGFYYLNIKRFFNENCKQAPFEWKSVFGLIITGICFSIFATDSSLLLFSTLFSTAVLVWLFHDRLDLYHGLYALILGFVVELFGVSTGQWAYPEPDFLGIPYWFATMWISVGILGRRFLFPLARLSSFKLGTIKERSRTD